jgi:hypothetical protein
MELAYPFLRTAAASLRPSLSLIVPGALAAAFVTLGATWPHFGSRSLYGVAPETLLGIVKLLAASSIGFFLTAVQRHRAIADRSAVAPRPLEQAQVLLCLAGALVVMLIGDSLARAVGIIGGASLIRFRTPIDDPKDATVLFLLLGLGMASGLGHFGVAGLATMFLALLLLTFNGVPDSKLRSLTLQVVCAGANNLPSAQIESVLQRHAASFEPREIAKGDRPVMRYQVSLDPAVPLALVSQQLLDDPEAAIQSLSWDTPKKERFQQ